MLVASLVFAAVPQVAERAAVADGAADEAELHFTLGAEAYRKGDFMGALQHFLTSNRLVPNRNVKFNIARAYEQLGRFPDAYRYYVAALDGETDARILDDVGKAVTRVAAKVAVVDITSTPPGASIYIARRDLGTIAQTPARIGLAAGTYQFIVELPGHEPYTTEPTVVGAGTPTTLVVPLIRIVGSIAVGGDAGLEVHVDAEDGPVACTTPCTTQAAPGPHLLYFHRDGFTATARTVNVEVGKPASLSVRAVAQTGSLLVSADETNALIEIDDQPMGFTPAVMGNVAVGRRRVRVTARGFLPVEREVEVRTGEQARLADLELIPQRQVSAASRTEEQIDDAPASVTIISHQELEAFAYPNVLEALRGVRGFATNFDSTYGNASVRGLGQSSDYNNRLLLLSDGAILNEDVLYQPFIQYDGRTDLGDVERIEIIRGPGSVLYGTGAMSGVINLVLREKDAPTSQHVQASASEDGVARVRGGFTQRFGRDAGVWASVSGARNEGRAEALRFDEDGDGTPDRVVVDRFDRFVSWSTAARAWWHDVTAQAFWTSRTLQIPTGPSASRVDDPRDQDVDSRFLAEVRYEPRLSDRLALMVRAYGNYARYRSILHFDAVDDTSGTTFDQLYQETYTSGWAGAEARLTATLGPHLRLAVGTEVASHFRVDMVGGQDDADGSFQQIFDVAAPYRVYAGYGVLDYKPTDKISAQLGARVDRWDASQAQLSDVTGNAVAQDFTSLSPRLAIIAKPTPRDIAKLMIGRAFRAPSTYEYFYNDGGTTEVTSDCCGERLRPETTYSAELEWTHRLGRSWSALGSLYATLARDIIETATVTSDVLAQHPEYSTDAFYYRNSSEDQILTGVDAEVRRELRAGIMLSGQVGALLARYSAAPAPDVSDNRRIPNAPVVFGAVKAIAPIVANRLTIAARAAFEDRRRINLASDALTDRAVIADVVLSGTLPRYGLDYAAGVYNLLDWRLSLPAEPFAAEVIPQAGRTFIVSLTLTR